MQSPTLFRNLGLVLGGVAVVSGAAIDSNGVIIDTAGCEGVLFIQPIDASADTGVATLKIEQNDLNQDGGMAALSGAVASAISAGANGLQGKFLVIDVYRPRERYIQAVRTSSVAAITYGQCIAIRYGSKKVPVTPAASVAASASVTSPPEV